MSPPPSCFSFFKSKPRQRPFDDDNYETESTASTLVSSFQESKLADKFDQVDTTDRLSGLRTQMKEHGLDCYIIPTDDAHQSEIVGAADRRREFISGFTGSAGQAIVTADKAYLLTDSRYWLQAGAQLDNNWTLVKVAGPAMPKTWVEWLPTQAKQSRVGLDPRFVSQAVIVPLQARLKKLGSVLVFPDSNLVDAVWKDKPKLSDAPLYLHPLKFTGEHSRDKLRRLREWIGTVGEEEEEPVGNLLADLASIAYLLNLRGNDISFSPVFTSYLWIGLKDATLFVESTKVPEDVAEYLSSVDVNVRPYDDVWKFLSDGEWGQVGKVIIAPNTSYAIYNAITPEKVEVLPSQVDIMKSIKNETEIEGFRRAYLRDSVCFARLYGWLEDRISKGKEVTEWEAAEYIAQLRYKTENNVGLAYANISASGPNAALPHYGPGKETSRVIDTATPYLNDTGGNYLDGTTDTTRTVHFGTPTEEQKEAFTRVLQGHIALDSAIFPEGTTGLHLDVLARNKLWRDGLNYLHGTGHGFGQFLNVHEGPQGFGIHVPFQLGHVVTNEPGFYKADDFGIRIESALAIRRVKTKHSFNGDIWLGFERFTQVPIDVRLVERKLMTLEEKQWLKDHNQLCLEKLSPLLVDDKLALDWVKKQARWAAGLA